MATAQRAVEEPASPRGAASSALATNPPSFSSRSISAAVA